MIQQIVQKLKAILDANTLLQTSYSYERADPTGTPFATITPSANESDYNTTTENKRTYAFLIRLFTERAGQTQPEDAENAMRTLVDSVLNDLDSNYTLSGMTVPTGYTFHLMRAAPSAWGYTGVGENEYRVAEIKVQCVVSVDVTLI